MIVRVNAIWSSVARATVRKAVLGGAVAGAWAASCAWAAHDFSRYEIILRTMPFGDTRLAPAVASNAVPAVVPPSQTFVRNLRLVALRERGATVRVGFVDITGKPQPRQYWLYVGETSDDGIEVVEADFEAGKALLRKSGDQQWLLLTGRGPAAPAVPAPMSPAMTRSAPSLPNPTAGSYAARMHARQEALRTRVVQPPQLSGEALQKHLESYNMQLIREGKPPLPIALTREQDTQLVHEGVLPPQDGPPAVAAPPAPSQLTPQGE